MRQRPKPVFSASSRPDISRPCLRLAICSRVVISKSVVCLHDHQILDAHHGHKFPRRMNVISVGVERKEAQLALIRLPSAGVVLRRRCSCKAVQEPRSFHPKSAGRQKIFDASFAFSRARLEHRIIYADVFAFRIQALKRRREFARAVVGNLLEQSGGFRQMFSDSVDQCARAPQKHTAIPEVVSGSQEFCRCEAPAVSR